VLTFLARWSPERSRTAIHALCRRALDTV